MKYILKIEVLFEEQKSGQIYVTGVDANETITCSDFKTLINEKNKFLNSYEIVSEKMSIKNKELLDTELVPKESGLKYSLTLKKK